MCWLRYGETTETPGCAKPDWANVTSAGLSMSPAMAARTSGRVSHGSPIEPVVGPLGQSAQPSASNRSGRRRPAVEAQLAEIRAGGDVGGDAGRALQRLARVAGKLSRKSTSPESRALTWASSLSKNW